MITAIDYSPETGEVTLTWNSVEDARYAVFFSRDMTDWDSDLDDSVMPDPGEQTTETFDLNEAGIAGEERLYFRVERQTP